MSKKGPGKNRKTAAAAATESMAGEFHELAAVREQAEPRAEEFLSFVDFWQRSAGQAASKVAAGQDHATGQDGSAGQDNAAGAEAAAGDARQMGEPDPRETARREAAEIIEQAQSEAAQLKETARQEGRAEGERQGRKEGKKEYAQRLAKLDQVLKTLDGQRGAIIERYRQELLTLVTTLSDRLVHHEVSTNPAVIERCFRDAMAYVVENSLVKVHLNPDDFHRLKEAGLADPTLFGGKNRIQLLEDPAIAAGGCLLKSDFGEVDATLDSARDKLYQAVDQAFQAALGQVDATAEEPVEVSPPPVTPEEVDAEPQEDEPQQEPAAEPEVRAEPEIQAAAEATEPEAPAEPETQATVASQAEPATAAGEPPVAENFPATAEERDEPQSRPEAAVNG